jgi:DNA-binding HxlR family transcriptional regulator
VSADRIRRRRASARPSTRYELTERGDAVADIVGQPEEIEERFD